MIGARIGPVVGPRLRPRIGLVDGNGSPAISLALTDSADPVGISTNFNYLLVVTNVSAATLASVSAVVTLPSAVTFVSGSGTGWTVNNVSGTVTCTRATLAVGAAPTITITVTASATPATATAIANATATDVIPANQVAQTTTISSSQTTLSVAINDSADPVSGSTNFDFTIVVTNTGVVTATTVSAVITLDASVTYVTGSGTGWGVSTFGQVITFTRASLAVGAAPTITVTVTAGSTGLTASTTADATAGNAPPAAQDTETTVIQATTLTVALTDSVDPAITLVNFAYSFVVTNTGSNTAVTVSAPVTLDSSLTFVSGSGTGWTVNHSAGTVTCTRATLAVGAAPTVTITVTTGGSALTASSAGNASAGNAPAATTSTQTTVIKLVDSDATSLIRCPSSATQWSDFNAYHVAIGTTNFPNVAPSLLWLCQEASGDLADSIGSFTGTASGTPLTYQSAVTGWTRLSLDGANAGTGLVTNTSASLPDPLATSIMTIGYTKMSSAPAADQSIVTIGIGTFTSDLFTSGGKLKMTSGVNTATGTASPSGAVHPIGLMHDQTNSRATAWSEQEILSVTKSAVALKRFRMFFGFPGGALYRVAFFGAAAELSNNNVRALLVALGWTVVW